MARLAVQAGMVQKQVTAQGWLMSTPEGNAPDPTLTNTVRLNNCSRTKIVDVEGRLK